MTEVSVVGPGGGEVLRLGTPQMRILEDGHTTGHRLGMGEITIAPHTQGPPQHRHARHDEGFYVVSGTARFTVGETVYDAPTGTLVIIPPGAPHTFANPTGQTTVILNTFTSDLYVEYFPRPARHDRRRPGADPRDHDRGDEPLCHRAGHRLRLAPDRSGPANRRTPHP